MESLKKQFSIYESYKVENLDLKLSFDEFSLLTYYHSLISDELKKDLKENRNYKKSKFDNVLFKLNEIITDGNIKKN